MAEKAIATAPAKKTEPLNKIECVENAMKVLGKDAKPVALRDYLLKTYNLNMKPDHISANKSTILKRLGKSTSTKKPSGSVGAKVVTKPAKKTKVKRKPTPLAKVTMPAAKTTTTMNSKSMALSLQQEALVVKGLVDRMGLDNLQTLIALVTKSKS